LKAGMTEGEMMQNGDPPAMEDFIKVSLILSFCRHISKASDKSHGSVIVVYIYFTF
jgi:hypothetical protein